MRPPALLLPALVAALAAAPFPAGGAGLPDRDQTPASTTAPTDQEPSPGQVIYNDYASRVQSGEKVDIFSVLQKFLSSPEARDAAQWISKLAAASNRYGQGDPSTERRLWEQYIRSRADDPAGYAGLGKNSLEQQDYNAAIAAYTRAIDLGSAKPETFYGRGMAAERLGDTELAHQDAAMALRMSPQNPNAYSLFKLTENQVSKARVDPATGKILAAGASGFAAGSGGGAVASGGDRLPTVMPDPHTAETDPLRASAALTQSAQRSLQVKDYDSALDAARRATELNPRNAQAFNLLATAYEKKGDHAAAVAAADQALAIEPGSVPALNTRSWSLSGLRLFDKALDDAGRIIGLDASNAFGWINEGRALGGLSRRSEMLDALQRAATLDPRFRSLHDAAVQLPGTKDTEILFAGLMDGSLPDGRARRGRSRQFFVVLVSSLSGGLLIVLGLLHVFSSRWREGVSRTMGRLLGRASHPGRAGAPGGAELPADGPIASYDIVRVIATGGMGVVYEALDAGLGRRVAIKKMRGEIRDDPKLRGRFLDEARLTAALRHPNIVQIHSILDEGRELYLVFEFVEGKTLKEVLGAEKRLSWPRALEVARQACSALEFAHAKGVVHRDLKPENLMLDKDGHLKVMDLGLARYAPEPTQTMATTVWGTPAYMAPEAEEGDIRPQSDLYSLAVCLYEFLTGKPPFTGKAGPMFASKSRGEFEPPSRSRPELPDGVDAFMARALSPRPDARFPTAKAFREALDRLA